LSLRRAAGVLLTASLAACHSSPGVLATPTDRLDFSGVEQFWRVADVLARGREPDSSAWNALFSTPGYAALEAREHRRSAISTAMAAAFSPSHSVQRDSLLRANSWATRVLRHLETLGPRRAALDTFARSLLDRHVLDEAVREVRRLVPPGTTERYGTPRVAFLYFLPDGRGYPDLIVADLSNVSSKPPVPFFAHELTHFYTAKLSAERQLGPHAQRTDPSATAVLDLLTKIAEESVGDQFDKTSIDSTDSALERAGYPEEWRKYIADYRRAYVGAADGVVKLNRMLEAIAADSPRTRTIVDSVNRELPLEGRPVGMFMARAIHRTLGDAKLASTVGDAVAFFLAYSDAASRPECRCPLLSSTALRVVNNLRIKP
jgi:hypothetical protein